MGLAFMLLASYCRRPCSRHTWRPRFHVCKPRLQKRCLFFSILVVVRCCSAESVLEVGVGAEEAPCEEKDDKEAVDSSSSLSLLLLSSSSSASFSHQSDSFRGLSKKFSARCKERKERIIYYDGKRREYISQMASFVQIIHPTELALRVETYQPSTKEPNPRPDPSSIPCHPPAAAWCCCCAGDGGPSSSSCYRAAVCWVAYDSVPSRHCLRGTKRLKNFIVAAARLIGWWFLWAESERRIAEACRWHPRTRSLRKSSPREKEKVPSRKSTHAGARSSK